MSKLAFLFPGQGSQSLAMLADLAAQYPQIIDTFKEASEGADKDLWSIAQQGPVELLNRTENTQPALLAASVAVWRLWQVQNGAVPDYLSGHSLGEYSALVCAGAISLKDAAWLVTERGKLMQAAVPNGVGAMAAVLGAEDDLIAQICAQVAGNEIVAPANFNSPGQTVIAGHVGAVDRALAALAESGVKRAIKLPVSVPSHTMLMREAANQLAEKIASLTWTLPKISVVQNVQAKAYSDLAAIKSGLVQQLYSPVRWTECVQELQRLGVNKAFECGPGKVLTGLVKRIDKSLECGALGSAAEFSSALQN